jgi:hypothetical protein
MENTMDVIETGQAGGRPPLNSATISLEKAFGEQLPSKWETLVSSLADTTAPGYSPWDESYQVTLRGAAKDKNYWAEFHHTELFRRLFRCAVWITPHFLEHAWYFMLAEGLDELLIPVQWTKKKERTIRITRDTVFNMHSCNSGVKV